jgi:hypothetical protein
VAARVTIGVYDVARFQAAMAKTSREYELFRLLKEPEKHLPHKFRHRPGGRLMRLCSESSARIVLG